MFVPLHDNTPLRLIRFQFFTGLIVVLNFVIFIYTHHLAGGQGEIGIATSLGAIPSVITNNAQLPANLQLVPDEATLFTYMFLHAGWMHLIANMLFLWVFADNVEDSFGHIPFLMFYLICGVAAAFAHAVTAPTSNAPLIGASGAVSGVMAAYLVLFPRARVWVLLFMKLPLRISALWALVGWFAFQVISMLTDDPKGEVIVAWWAHIGGFATGLVITIILRNVFKARFEGH